MRWCVLALAATVSFAGCEQHQPTVTRDNAESETSAPHPSSNPHSSSEMAAFHSFHKSDSKDQQVSTEGPIVQLGTMQLEAPESWVRKQPRIDFIRAEFSLPQFEGDSGDGRLTVSVAGGSVLENVDRWRGQFKGELKDDSTEEVEVSETAITLVDFSGTFEDQRGPFAPAETHPDYRMLGAIFPIGDQLHFVKCYGPQKTIAANAEQFQAFVRSLKSSGSAD
jgi:hypothetical protein